MPPSVVTTFLILISVGVADAALPSQILNAPLVSPSAILRSVAPLVSVKATLFTFTVLTESIALALTSAIAPVKVVAVVPIFTVPIVSLMPSVCVPK